MKSKNSLPSALSMMSESEYSACLYLGELLEKDGIQAYESALDEAVKHCPEILEFELLRLEGTLDFSPEITNVTTFQTFDH